MPVNERYGDIATVIAKDGPVHLAGKSFLSTYAHLGLLGGERVDAIEVACVHSVTLAG